MVKQGHTKVGMYAAGMFVSGRDILPLLVKTHQRGNTGNIFTEL
jgi:hypothetical protein